MGTAGLTDHSFFHSFYKKLEKDQSNILPIDGAPQAVFKLANSYTLVAVSSRELFMERETRKWLSKNFKNMFQTLLLVGHIKNAKQTKGEACVELGARWLIDDNIDHCKSAAQKGVTPVLFGDYGWHDEFDGSMDYCKDWTAVLEYFDGRN